MSPCLLSDVVSLKDLSAWQEGEEVLSGYAEHVPLRPSIKLDATYTVCTEGNLYTIPSHW